MDGKKDDYNLPDVFQVSASAIPLPFKKSTPLRRKRSRLQQDILPLLPTTICWFLLISSGYNFVRVRFGGTRNLAVNYINFTNVNHQRDLISSQNKHYRSNARLRILYVLTSVADKDNGKRGTIKNHDRFNNTLVPVLRESIHSLSSRYDVDVYLITHYNITTAHYELLRAALPESVGLQTWSDASPHGYAIEYSTTLIRDIVQSLSRQHRYVIKDKFVYYDMFVNFEDDMLVTVDHVHQFVQLSWKLHKMHQQASIKLLPGMPNTSTEMMKKFYGPMTQYQINRMLPGFIRVEVNLQAVTEEDTDHESFHTPNSRSKVGRWLWRNNFCGQARNRYPQIPQDYYWNATITNAIIEAQPCCHLRFQESLSMNRPIARPHSKDLYYWETGIEVLGVRQLPTIPHPEWFLMQVGNNESVYEDARYPIGDYWTGQDGYFAVKPEGGGFSGSQRPPRTQGRYFNNQGGWMALRRQIMDWHTKWCLGGGFLPPYNLPGYRSDGLSKSVEYWSGGLQLSGVMGCNLQRIIPLDPTQFGRHLLYHTSNNKQRTPAIEYRFSGLSVQESWGQLNTVRKNAERAMRKELNNQSITAAARGGKSV